MTQELRKLANEWIERECDEDDIRCDGGSTSTNKLMRAYIAAANPAAILSLLDRLEKAEKDAERYRWLRDTGTQGFSNGTPQRGVTIAMDGSVKLHFVYWMTQQQLDKSIDEAMEAIK